MPQYRGRITRLGPNGARVRIPSLSSTHEYGPFPVVTPHDLLENDEVLLTNITGVKEDLVVLGKLTVETTPEVVDGGDINDPSVEDSWISPKYAGQSGGGSGEPGPTGPEGPQGDPGLSAYDIAVTEGFSGTLGEWLDSLVGPEGPEGPQGIQGPQGVQGDPGPKGDTGDTGIQGPEGPQGDPGPAGADGADGAQGPIGPQGPEGTPAGVNLVKDHMFLDPAMNAIRFDTNWVPDGAGAVNGTAVNSARLWVIGDKISSSSATAPTVNRYQVNTGGATVRLSYWINASIDREVRWQINQWDSSGAVVSVPTTYHSVTEIKAGANTLISATFQLEKATRYFAAAIVMDGGYVDGGGDAKVWDPSVTFVDASNFFVFQGAAADGTTDDTAVFQAAFREIEARGGGTLLIPAKNYKLSTTECPILPSNTHVLAYGATFISVDTNIRGVFVSNTRDGVTPGYGAGVVNFRWSGGTFKGDFSVTGRTQCPFALHHAQHHVYEDIIFDQVHGGVGHVYDLGACDDIVIQRCKFIGMKGDSAHIEAVNVDLSYYGTLTGGTLKYGASGLASKNITVDNCKFYPVTVSGTTYPCSNPLGTHIAREGLWYENIRFTNNEVIDPPINPAEDLTDTSDDDFYAGAVHMPQVDGFWIENNTFKMTAGRKTRAITIMSQYKGVRASSSLTGSTTRGTYTTPVPAKNVYIRDNVFDGFGSGTADPDAVVYIKGVANGYVDGIHVQGNEFRNGANVSGAGGSAGCAVYMQYLKNVYVIENSCSDFYRALYVWNGANANIDQNSFARCVYRSFLSRELTGFSIDQNTVHNSGPIQLNQSANVHGTVMGNVILREASSGVTEVAAISLDSSDGIICTNNMIRNLGTSITGAAINGNTGVTESIVSQNIIKGWSTPVATLAASSVVKDNV